MDREFQRQEQTNFSWFILAALVVSLYFPSSIGGSIIEQLSLLGNSLALSILLFGALLCRVSLNKLILSLGLSFLLIVSLLSFLSPFDNVTLGAIVPYLTMIFILSLLYKDIGFSRNQVVFLLFFSFFQLIISFSIVFSISWVKSIFESYYQMVPDLYYYMIGWESKPVITYATHSVAGFVFFLFSLFFAVLYYKVSGFLLKLTCIFVSFLYCVLLVLLFSNTGFFLFVGMMMVYFYLAMKNSSYQLKTVYIFVLVASFFYVFINYYEEIVFSSEKVVEVLTSDKNGILARLSMNSRLAGSYAYVFENPIQGVGFTYNENIAFGDNFLSEYVLRGGFVGYFIYILMISLFCFGNFTKKIISAMLLFFIFISDFGYPLLVAYRFVFFFPIIVILTNYIHRGLHDKERSCIHPR